MTIEEARGIKERFEVRGIKEQLGRDVTVNTFSYIEALKVLLKAKEAKLKGATVIPKKWRVSWLKQTVKMKPNNVRIRCECLLIHKGTDVRCIGVGNTSEEALQDALKQINNA